MRAICLSFIESLRVKHVTHMVRRCLEAEFQGRDKLLLTYETRLVSDGQFLTANPYVAFAILRRREAGWKISTMQFAADRQNPASTALRHWATRMARRAGS